MTSNKTAAEIRTDATDDGQRLDRVLALHFPELSRTRLKGLIEAGQVTQDGNALRNPSLRVKRDQNFVVILPQVERAVPEPQLIALDIHFEDAHLIVIDKPAGMVVHPAPGNPDGTLVNAVLGHCGASLSGIGGICRPGIVHRLDKDTSGVMVVAKTEAVHQALSRDFAARRVDRAYTRYQVEQAYQASAAIVQCRLATGRTHQIRVHLAHLGHPLIGDPVYGTRAGRVVAREGAVGAQIAAFPRQALHARLLGFTHPIEKQHLEFHSPLPADMQELARSLERL
jgi:23S rRNA pseudouridine1911/1915/1917 synthase